MTIRVLTALVLILFYAVIGAQAGEVKNGHADKDDHQPVWSSPLIFFQKVISRADGDRDPMYPSCSHYAATVFKRYNPMLAMILTSDRLLRCGHDEVRSAPKVFVNGSARTFDPVKANTFWWHKH